MRDVQSLIRSVRHMDVTFRIWGEMHSHLKKAEVAIVAFRGSNGSLHRARNPMVKPGKKGRKQKLLIA